MARGVGLLAFVRGVVLGAVVVQFGVELAGFVELILKNDDAARGLEAGALVDQFPHVSGETKLVARIASVLAGRALRRQELRFIQSTQNPGVVPSNSAAPVHRVGGMVFVVEVVDSGRPGAHQSPDVSRRFTDRSFRCPERVDGAWYTCVSAGPNPFTAEGSRYSMGDPCSARVHRAGCQAVVVCAG